MSFDIEKFGATDKDICDLQACTWSVEYWFDPRRLSDDCVVMMREDAIALAKHFKITQEEIEGFEG